VTPAEAIHDAAAQIRAVVSAAGVDADESAPPQHPQTAHTRGSPTASPDGGTAGAPPSVTEQATADAAPSRHNWMRQAVEERPLSAAARNLVIAFVDTDRVEPEAPHPQLGGSLISTMPAACLSRSMRWAFAGIGAPISIAKSRNS